MKIKLVFLAVLGVTNMLFGSVNKIDSLKELISHLKGAGKETLIIFDIDETLTLPEDPAFQRANFTPHVKTLREIKGQIDPARLHLYINTIFLYSSGILIEEETPTWLKSWQEQGIKMVALSAAMSGKIDGVNILDKRVENFRNLGIDFSTSFPEHEEIVFPNINLFYGSSARYKKGILHANLSEKSPVLIAFLKHLKQQPEKILFVDDRLEWVEEMEALLQKNHPDVQFIGFHYHGVNNFPSAVITEEQMRARWQQVATKTNSLSFP